MKRECAKVEQRHHCGGGAPPAHIVRAVLCGVAIIVTMGSDAIPAEPSLTQLTTDGRLKQRPHWSPDGKTLVFARHVGATIQLFLLDVKTGKERRLNKRTAPEYDAVFSPDGKRLAFAFDKISPNQGDIEVYVCDIDGKNLKPVAFTQGKLSHEESPAWAPDGKRLAYTSTRDGNQELYVIGIDGKGRKRLTSNPAIDAHPTWSPDGKTIAFATNRWGDLEIGSVNLASGVVTRLTHSKGLDDYPAWSPDGKRLAFTSNRDGNFEIYTIKADGSDPKNATNSAGLDNFPAWTPDGRLTFVSNRSGGFDVYVEKKR